MYGWRLPTGKIYLFFKTIKKIEIADLALTIKNFYD